MSKKDVVRICVMVNGVTYKVSAIYLLNDGSFKVDVPYCNYDRGQIIKTATDYRPAAISSEDYLKAYFSVNRPQLSIHASGFVQFSGQGITSGIDSATGIIKGMGLMSNPLRTPVFSGPTFSITCWGFKEGYEVVNYKPLKNIVYEKDVVTEQLPASTDRESLNSFVLQGWIIPFSERNNESTIYKNEEGEMIVISLPDTPPGVLFPMRIIRLKNLPCVIGLLPSFQKFHNDPSHTFGFVLNAPGEPSKEKAGYWDVMMAIYPDAFQKIYASLDYTPPGTPANP